MGINKPEGIVITFHIGGKDKGSVRSHLVGKGYIDIQYIEENPNFENSLK